MFNGDEWREEARKVLNALDEEQYPEVCETLEDILDEAYTPFTAAANLEDCDKPKVLPPSVVAYITALYEMEIAQGNDHAMNNLGARYYCGDRGFEQSFAKAVELYDMAAARGNRHAQENLGYCYYYGRNMPVDYEKAFHYYALGAFDGWLISLYKIGDMYLNGYYVQKNEREAFYIYHRCLREMTNQNQRYIEGPVRLRLGKMFLKGIATEPDPEQALMHFQLAELALFRMVKDGDYMYKNSLRAAIEGQAEARKLLAAQLPDQEWTFDN